MGLTACHKAAASTACLTATATAILLWGIGAEAVYFRDYLQGGFLLADALIVTLLESLTAWQYLEWRRTRCQLQAAPLCRLPPRLLRALDTFRRAALYTLLSVPCFVRVRRIWLPLVPGAMLLLSAALYTLKYCCALRKQQTLVKVPTFVRFKDESASAETQAPTPEPRLSHQSSFTSSHSGGSVQMGSKDSGIEASQRDVAAAAAAAAAAASVAAAANAASSAGEASGHRKPRGLVRAYSSSPDRCCLINEDSLSLRD